MDPAVISASAAVLGSLAGGAASIGTAWLTLKTQGRRESIQVETRKRELLYSEFISVGSKLFLDAVDHNLDRPDVLLGAYSLVNRIRLVSSDAVLEAAEVAVTHIVKTYRAPNLPLEKLLDMATSRGFDDPLKAFSVACRHELQSLHRDWV